MAITKLLFAVMLLFHFIAVSAQPTCKDSLPASLFVNPSFEEYSGCNQVHLDLEGGLIDYSSNMGGVTVVGWHPFILNFAIGYFNYDCRSGNFSSIFNDVLSSNFGIHYPAVPFPLPDGNGFINTYQKFKSDESQSSKSYVTTCLGTPLRGGKTYVFSFDFAFGITKSTNPTFLAASPSPFRIAVFGRKDCPGYPIITDHPDSATGCLTNRSGWIQLGVIELVGKNEWVRGVIDFTPPVDISCIGIGPDCSLNTHIGDTSAFYYMDNFVLAAKEAFLYKQIQLISGNPCTHGYVLKAPDYTNAKYSWYKDGKLIPNASSKILGLDDKPESAGNYTANIVIDDNSCVNTLPFKVEYSTVDNFDLGNDSILCAGGSILLHANYPEVVNYYWNDGSTLSYLPVTKSGLYWTEITDKYGCNKRDSLKVSIKNCDNCSFFIPTAFTPNNDGLNDYFRIKPTCPNVKIKQFKMRIYNKLGQMIFETDDIGAGWDGVKNGYPQPSGSYAYSISYSFDNKSRIEKGSFILIR